MNVFCRFTHRSLKENRTRTIVTIIGIVLSMALFTAVIQGAYSGRDFLIRAQEERLGSYHAYYYQLTGEEAQTVRDTQGVSDTTMWRTVGWAEVGSVNTYKPYLLIKAIDENFTDLVTVHLISGRLPENDREITIPAHLSSNGGVEWKVGDQVTLNVGERTSDGYVLHEGNNYVEEVEEQITNSSERTYTVVGLYERFAYEIEQYSCPGYTALTAGEGSGAVGCFFKVERPDRFYRFMEQHKVSKNYRANSELLLMYGSLSDIGLVQVLFGFAVVLVFLIAFGSISLIYNSFSISVSERTRQFGILKSVGATRKQIHFTVMYEAGLLACIAIPIGIVVGCAGIGITLWCLRDSFTFLLDPGQNIQMKLVISPIGLGISALLCLITALISAWIPARRAIRISAIDSIRQSQDVKLSARDVRTSWLTRKLFGFEGMIAAKNFARNKKRYRATIFSLFLSVTLFITASSFCSYLGDAVSGVADATDDPEADIQFFNHQLESDIKPQEMLEILKVEGVEEIAFCSAGYAYLYFDESDVSDSRKDFMNRMYLGSEYIPSYAYDAGTNVCFVDDASFLKLCEKYNLDSSLYFNPDAPLAIACNHINARYITQDNRLRWAEFDMFDEAALPVQGRQEYVKEIEGYFYVSSAEDEVGNKTYIYCPTGYEEAYYDDTVQFDEKLLLTLTKEEAIEDVYLTIGALIDEREFYMPGSTEFAILYPYSMKQSSLLNMQGVYADTPYYYINADDHRAVYDRINEAVGERGLSSVYLYNQAEGREENEMVVTVINVFSYGFIILISLIAMTNVFNTISTSIMLRRREFAMLRSVGLTTGGFDKMMNYECIIYGAKGLLWGLPAAFLLTYALYRITQNSFDTNFYVPAHSIVIAVGSVFAVVFATMLYATRRIRRDNPIDALRNENL